MCTKKSIEKRYIFFPIYCVLTGLGANYYFSFWEVNEFYNWANFDYKLIFNFQSENSPSKPSWISPQKVKLSQILTKEYVVKEK